MKRIWKNHGLSIVLAFFFLLFWGGQAVAGWKVHNEEQWIHQAPQLRFGAYLLSGHFWGATAENWESEFLQMGAYVVLTCFLFQKGSAESKDPENPDEGKAPKGRYGFLRRNSLSLAFLVLFALAFVAHAKGGLLESNQERLEHGQSVETLGEFLRNPEFWFQSLQNWQSEFLAVLAIVVLSIFLRQDGSPESKRVDEPNSKTGK